jgi:hypothetical protein
MPPGLGIGPLASFCVTFIGCTDAELMAVETALGTARGSLTYATRSVPSVAASSFLRIQVHAVVLTPASLARATNEDTEIIRAASALGTCRIYLVAFDKSVGKADTSPFDDFIQRSSDHSVNTIAQQIIGFFHEADALNRYSTHRGVRDAACLWIYPILAFLWNFSYVIGALHILNTLMHVKGHELWPSVHVHSAARLVANFFGAFFIITSATAIFRNALYSVRVMKHLSLELLLWAGFFGLAATATAYSIAGFGDSALRILAPSALAVVAYSSYVYCRRVRAECTSLSELRTAMDDNQRRTTIVDRVGKAPLGSNAYPFFSFRSKSLFISYAPASEWSRTTADSIRLSTGRNGFDVFLDQSSIPSGSLWRQALLRSLSECGLFITVLDNQSAASGWVLAECVYAAMLRKSIGKPHILVIVPSTEQLDLLRRGPFGVLFRDLFDFRHVIRDGGTIVIVEDDELSEARILQALSRIRPMRLLA